MPHPSRLPRPAPLWTADGEYTGAATTAAGLVVSQRGDRIVAINPASGRTVWQSVLSRRSRGRLHVVGGRILVAQHVLIEAATRDHADLELSRAHGQWHVVSAAVLGDLDTCWIKR
jgi:hypothetical protein